MPTPVVASTVEERQLLHTQRSFLTVRELANRATATFVGLSHVGWKAPIHRDGMVEDAEIRTLIDAGAVGEIAGWTFDAAGVPLKGGVNDRVAGIPLDDLRRPNTIAVAGGQEKVSAILAALRGRLITGIITDETTAQALLKLA